MAEIRPELTDEAVRRTFGGNVKRIRVGLGLTQATLARTAGVGQRQVSQIESGQIDIRMSTAQRIARALFTTIERLLNAN